MISAKYDLSEFLEWCITCTRAEIKASIQVELLAVEEALARIPTKERHHSPAFQYDQHLGRIDHFIRYGSKPGSISSAEWQAYRPLAEALAARGEFTQIVLEQFEK